MAKYHPTEDEARTLHRQARELADKAIARGLYGLGKRWDLVALRFALMTARTPREVGEARQAVRTTPREAVEHERRLVLDGELQARSCGC